MRVGKYKDSKPPEGHRDVTSHLYTVIYGCKSQFSASWARYMHNSCPLLLGLPCLVRKNVVPLYRVFRCPCTIAVWIRLFPQRGVVPNVSLLRLGVGESLARSVIPGRR